MHATDHERVSIDARASAGSAFFCSDSSLSERELILMALDLAGRTNATGGWAHRVLDITVAVLMLVLLLPVMALAAACVALSSPGPVIFKQIRVGMKGQAFGCYKFRSMRIDAEQHLTRLLEEKPKLRNEWISNHKLNRDPRITAIGRILRHSSIDELPQLINVIRGDMSLVGPRPIVHSEMLKYGRYLTSYFSVRPGLTGLWQVTGRNNSSYRRRVAADVLYTRSKSLWLDLKILLLTIPAVLTGRGSC
jgi:exopolysaccharide production protein ExoY